MIPLLAAAMPVFEGGTGVSWWQTVGGLAAVFALLLLFLKFLARMNRSGKVGQASMLSVWGLGPRREIQVLRLGEDVHYIYRHDGAMVLLRQETYAAWQAKGAETATEAPSSGLLARLLGDRFPMLGRPAAAHRH